MFSVGYSKKDIQDIQDIQKTANTTSYFAYLFNETPFYGTYVSKEKFMVKLFLKSEICEILLQLWSLIFPKAAFPKIKKSELFEP